MSPRKRHSAAPVAEPAKALKKEPPHALRRDQMAPDSARMRDRYFAEGKESQCRVVKGAIGGAAYLSPVLLLHSPGRPHTPKTPPAPSRRRSNISQKVISR